MNNNVGQFELCHLLSPMFFTEDNCQPTVTVLPICGGHIGLVSPVQVGDNHWLVLPQGSIRQGDGTVMYAALRVLRNTLGLQNQDYEGGRITALLQFDDRIPEGRPDSGKLKRHYVVGVKVTSSNRFFPNREVVNGFHFAKSPKEFLELTSPVARKRPVKHQGIVKSIREACSRRILGWSFDLPTAPVMA